MTIAAAPIPPILALTPADVQRCADGSMRNLTYDDVYFQSGHALDESRFVFLEKNNLPARFSALWQHARTGQQGGSFTVAELGFGTGLNMLLTCQLWNAIARAYRADIIPAHHPRLFLTSIEKHPIAKDDLGTLHGQWPELATESAALLAEYPAAIRGFHTLRLADDIDLLLCLGDVAEVLPQLNLHADAWFLDGFAPVKNPAMWDAALYSHLWRLSRADATLSTFSAAGHVRRALRTAGFSASKVKGYGTKWAMTVAHAVKDDPPAATALPRVAVIGAGLAGASVAFALAERGCQVSVFERHASAAAEASGNPVGILYPKPTVDDTARGQLATQGFLYTRHLLQKLCPDSFKTCGVLRLDMSASASQRGPKLVASHRFPAGFCDWQAETAYERSALWHACGGAVSPAMLCRALLNHPRIHTHYNTTISQAPVADHDVTVIATANAALGFAPDLALAPLRGQMITLRPTPASQQLTQVICHEGYLTPVINGVHYAGATFQKEGPHDAHDHRGVTRADDSRAVVETLTAALPGLGFTTDDIIDARAAYRATTPDKMPLVGRLSGPENTVHEGVYISAGFGAHALIAAPLCGAVLASLICGDRLPIPRLLFEHLDPARFEKRKNNKNQHVKW